MVEEDSSVLRSIYAQAAQNVERAGHGKEASLALESDTSSKRRARRSQVPAHARSSSDTSFSGMSSFGAVRTKFEFGHQRPAFFPPTFEAVTSHARHDSMFSIASVSSYGELINNGLNDPFNYAMLSHEGTADRDGLTSINEAISTFDEERHRKRFSTDSDVSSFYFRAPSQPHVTQQHGRDQSVISTTSMNGPPISLYNRSFGHNRSDSAGSGSSLAHAYGMHGASGGRAAWVRHQKDRSIDSVMSGFSAMRLGRPGVGDKMFESAADHGPLTAISASPPESVKADLARKSSYDSILDDDRRSTVDSIFDHTGQRSSMSSGSVFGYDANEPARGNLFPPTHFRPLSVISLGNPGTPREDDTMISMLGGGHVRRRSIGSSFEASPCFRHEKREKRKHSDSAHPFGYDDGSPNKARLIRRESVASTTSSKSKFGETRMTLAQSGLLHRNSLEDSCLSGEGEEDYTMHSGKKLPSASAVPTDNYYPQSGPQFSLAQRHPPVLTRGPWSRYPSHRTQHHPSLRLRVRSPANLNQALTLRVSRSFCKQPQPALVVQTSAPVPKAMATVVVPPKSHGSRPLIQSRKRFLGSPIHPRLADVPTRTASKTVQVCRRRLVTQCLARNQAWRLSSGMTTEELLASESITP